MERLIEWLGGEAQVWHLVRVGVLVAARVAPLTLFAPWLSMRTSPPILRAAVILALTVVLTPLAAESVQTVPVGGLNLALLAVKEALVGAVFAVASALPLHALTWAGRLTDTWRGASMAEIVAPHTGERSSPLGELYLLMGIAIFVALGGHRLAIAAFAEGLAQVPVGAASVGGAISDVALGATRLSANALAFATALAAPAAAAIILVEVSLGLLARTAPQIPVFFAGMPLRAATGVAAALLGLSILVGELPTAYRDAIDAAAQLLMPFGSR